MSPIRSTPPANPPQNDANRQRIDPLCGAHPAHDNNFHRCQPPAATTPPTTPTFTAAKPVRIHPAHIVLSSSAPSPRPPAPPKPSHSQQPATAPILDLSLFTIPAPPTASFHAKITGAGDSKASSHRQIHPARRHSTLKNELQSNS